METISIGGQSNPCQGNKCNSNRNASGSDASYFQESVQQYNTNDHGDCLSSAEGWQTN
jgi:hypothetical protein